MDELFVPLNSEAFYWFKDKGKSYELRAYGKKWTEKNIFEGRAVELRRGYSTGDKIKGRVGAIVIGSIHHIFDEIPYKNIIPVVESQEEAIQRVDNIFNGRREKYIAFEILNQAL